METYIVRIYRRNSNISQNLVGFVEEVGVEGKKPFKNPGQLLDILNGKTAGSLKADKPKKAKNGRKWNVSITQKE